MKPTDTQQASTADADICADLRTRCGQGTGIGLPFKSRDEAIKALCKAVFFGAEPVYPDITPPAPAADQCVCRECGTPRAIQCGASNAILTGKSLEIEQPCAKCGRVTWSKPLDVDALRGLPPAERPTPTIPQPKPAGLGRNADLTPHERPTPETDRKSKKRPTPQTDGQLASIAHEPRDVAIRRLGSALRGMERQLAEAREEIARLNKSLSNASSIYDAAREKIEEMETRHAAAMLHTQTIVDDANEAREQRDRLAEALEDILNDAPDSPLYKTRAAKSALAAVKGDQIEKPTLGQPRIGGVPS